MRLAPHPRDGPTPMIPRHSNRKKWTAPESGPGVRAEMISHLYGSLDTSVDCLDRAEKCEIWRHFYRSERQCRICWSIVDEQGNLAGRVAPYDDPNINCMASPATQPRIALHLDRSTHRRPRARARTNDVVLQVLGLPNLIFGLRSRQPLLSHVKNGCNDGEDHSTDNEPCCEIHETPLTGYYFSTPAQYSFWAQCSKRWLALDDHADTAVASTAEAGQSSRPK